MNNLDSVLSSRLRRWMRRLRSYRRCNGPLYYIRKFLWNDPCSNRYNLRRRGWPYLRLGVCSMMMDSLNRLCCRKSGHKNQKMVLERENGERWWRLNESNKTYQVFTELTEGCHNPHLDLLVDLTRNDDLEESPCCNLLLWEEAALCFPCSNKRDNDPIMTTELVSNTKIEGNDLLFWRCWTELIVYIYIKISIESERESEFYTTRLMW